MATPDVRVRLSAEGEAQVISAFRKVAAEASRTSGAATRSFGGLNASLGTLRSLLAGVAAAASVGALVAFTKNAGEAADAIGKMAQSVGASVRNLSALRGVATTANLGMEQLQAGLTIFNRRATEALAGNDKAQKSFRALGISLETIRGKDAAERIALVAEALSKMKDSPEKVALGFEFFGRQIGALIPFLNDLGEIGLQGAIDRARELGIVFTEDTARAAQTLNDDFAIMNAQAQSLAAQFIEGLAPSVHAALGGVQEDMAKSGSAAKEFGRSVGEALSIAVLGFEASIDQIGTAISKLLIELSAFARAIAFAVGAIATGGLGGIVEAFRIENKAAIDIMRLQDEFDARQAKRLQRAERRGEAATKGISGLPPFRAGQPDIDAPIIAEETRKKKEKSAEQLAFEAALNAFQAQRNELDFAAAKIQAQVNAGVLSELDGRQQLLELNRKNVPELLKLAKAAIAAAQAFGDPQAIERALELGRAIELMLIPLDAANQLLKQLGATAKDVLTDQLATIFRNATQETRHLIDVVRELALAVVDAIQTILAQELAAASVRALYRAASGLGGFFGFAGGGEVRRAEGGPVYGPGSGTSDSIPARLSAGEFVVRAAVVRQPGMLQALSAINLGSSTPSLGGSSRARRYAEGGLIASGGSSRLDASLTVALSPGLILQELQSPEGQRAVVRVVTKNRRATSSALGS